MASVGVIGSGTWGTALAILLNGNGHKVQLWSAVPAEVESLSVNRKHPNLGDTPIPEAIEITGDLKAAMKEQRSVGPVRAICLRETDSSKNETMVKTRSDRYKCSKGN